MPRAYPSPSIGTACGPQCAQMPNLASRNHSGQEYCLRDSSVGWNGPDWIGVEGSAESAEQASSVASRLIRLIVDEIERAFIIDFEPSFHPQSDALATLK